MRKSITIVAALWLVLTCAGVASALDQPISGHRLQLKQAAGRVKLVFQSKDPSFLFPAIGGPDDAVVNGALIEIIPDTVPAAGLTAGPGTGKPGWSAKAGTISRYKYSVPGYIPAGLATVILQEGKQLKVVAKSTGLPLPGDFAAVAVRITIGSLRSCAVFRGGAIVKSQAGRFLASNAPAPAIADCSDASLGLPNCAVGTAPTCGGPCPGDGVCTADGSQCRCVSPSAPCGDTNPTCNGTCGAGEECLATDPNAGGCACLPIGATACGLTGAPTCGGACSAGDVCRPTFGVGLPGDVGSFACGCAPPNPCSSETGLDCPNGFGCGVVVGSGGEAGCGAMTCAGSYPTCGGSCGDGGECQPVAGAASDFCICALPAPCDGACGGYGCPSGQVCALGPVCGCITP